MSIRDVFGRNININHDIRDRYKIIQKGFIFKDKDSKVKDYKYIFMLCLALGYKTGNRTPLKDTVGLLNVSSFKDPDLWTIFAIASEEYDGDLHILKNGPDIKKIATEYAHTGLGILENLIADNDSGVTLGLVIEKKAFEALSELS